jgi:GNAT superfamily N-acetyltransferase
MDRNAILALSRDIWDGGDYLHFVVDDWINDQEGLFLVGEFGPRLAAVAKTSRQLPATWWFEGMRVHPNFEGRGIATNVMRYLMAYVSQQGAQVARLVTSSQRLAVHRICSQMGWVKIAELSAYRAPALHDGAPDAFAPLAPEDASEAAQMAAAWHDPGVSNGLMDLGWEWVHLNPTHIALAAQTGRAWWWRGAQSQRQGVLSVWFDEEETSKDMKIELIACAPGDLPAMLSDYRRLAARRNMPEAAANLALLDGTTSAAQAAGFGRSWDKSLYVFEKVFA